VKLTTAKSKPRTLTISLIFLVCIILFQSSQINASSVPFYQGDGYEQGAYDASADQPTDFNWTRHSRFNAVNENLQTKWKFPVSTNTFTHSPAIGADGTVYIATEEAYSNYQSKLLAINPDGTLKWAYPIKYRAYSSPVIGADGYVYVTSGGKLYAVDALSGQPKWADGYDFNIGVIGKLAIDQNGILYIESQRKLLLAVDPTQPAVLWTTNVGFYMSHPSIDKDGVIYVQSEQEKKVQLSAINPDGTIRYSVIYENSINYEGTQYGSPLLDDQGNVYVVGKQKKKLYSIRASDGTLNWTKTLPYQINAHPAYDAAEKVIYIGVSTSTTDNFFALNVDGTEKWTMRLKSGVRTTPIIDAKGDIYVPIIGRGINVISKEGQLISTYSTGILAENANNISIGSDGTLYFTNFSGSEKAVYAVNGGINIPPVTEGGHGLKGEYYNNEDFTDKKFERVDSQIDFDWGYGSPHELIDPETYSVRWTGKIQPKYTDIYAFHAFIDDGVRLWVNDELIIDQWNLSDVAEFTGTIRLEAGQKYDIKLEYFNGPGYGFAQLQWSSAEFQAKEVIPSSALFLH